MKLRVEARLDYAFDAPTDILLQIEAAAIPEQSVADASTRLSECTHIARVAAQDGIGDRIWVQAERGLTVDYSATVAINRILADISTLPEVPPHLLPGETVQYLLPSRYCPSDRFQPFVNRTFGTVRGGARVAAVRDWIGENILYTPGASRSSTTATDTFVERQGVCRDFTHLLITLARAGGVPARFASVYAPKVEPPDFHAVAEVFLGGEWHLVDATGMAQEGQMAKIGVGRDAADVAFLTSFGPVTMNEQRVSVEVV
ncbi:transglutaminase family protein [Sphingomonas tabacisoli]|uniref:Transglutaminase family protein n=1 Tax=Sphingomonas tabacisoli TaxID=2249466 RepID=A0ABW4HYP3_9SPHN